MLHRLVLLRHAEASVDADSDHARPLTEHGQRDALRIAERIAAAGWVPQHLVSSSALRARQTAQVIAERYQIALHAHETLYHEGLMAIRRLLATLEPSVTTAMVVGHNPVLSTAASRLAHTSVALATANAACLSLEAESWLEAMTLEGSWDLRQLLVPG